jgi:LPS O-antigen subunit length determinant protein (WzzB/FepE family)
MTSSENDGSNKQTTGNDVQEGANFHEDEINLIEYFQVLWKRKWFIFLASVLPALVVGLAMFHQPRDYKTTYIYDAGLDEKGYRDAGLDEKGYRTLLDRFYCAENLDKVITSLKENSLEKYAQQITEARQIEDLKKLVNLEVSPSYFGSAGSSGKTNVEELQKLQQARGTLLIMTIEGKPQKDMYPIASVIRDDFEKVIPIYSVKDELSNNIEALKTNMAKIEEDRFGLGLEVERKKATLEKLKNLKSEEPSNVQGNITLQFNMDASSAYLPLAYRIQAVDSQIINLEESVKANEERYNYYKSLLTVNERLFDEVKSKTPLYYTIQEFHSFLDNIVKDYKDKELIDYLNAYIKSIENKMANTVPLIEKPKVYPVAKGTVKKSGIVFVVSLMIAVFAAFLLEGFKKSQVQTS